MRRFIEGVDIKRQIFLSLFGTWIKPLRIQLPCSQTLYFPFKVCRARVIEYKPQGIYCVQRKGVVVGEGENRRHVLYFSFARSFRSPMFLKRTKTTIKQRLFTG